MHKLYYHNQTNSSKAEVHPQTAPQTVQSRIRQAAHSRARRLLAGLSTLSLVISLLCTQTLTVSAGIKEDNIAANRAVPVESNLVENWPTGPIVNAEI